MQQIADTAPKAIPADAESQPLAPIGVAGATQAIDKPISTATTDVTAGPVATSPVEFGGREGLEPTRFGDWEKAGRCIDF